MRLRYVLFAFLACVALPGVVHLVTYVVLHVAFLASLMWAAVAAMAGVMAFGLYVYFPGVYGLVLKQMRQRALGTWLTLLSVLLGVALAATVLLLQRESRRLFGQSDFGYEIIVGPPKGSDLNLVLNTVYHLGRSEGNIPYDLYEQMSSPRSDYARLVKMALPFMVGDSYAGYRIVGTSPRMLGFDDTGNRMDSPWQYREGRSYELAEGRAFHPTRFEAVVGSEVAAARKMHVYDPNRSEAENEQRNAVFQATHGMPAAGEKPDIHKPEWRVVGILKPTHTAGDRALYVPVVSLYSIEEHSYGLIAQAMMKKGIDPTRVPAAQLLDVLRQLGFNPDELPKSVMRKFNLVPTTGPAVSTQPWLEGAGAKSAASAPPAGAGGELLTESHKEEDHDAHDEKHAKEEHGEEHAEGEDGHDHEEDAYHLDEQGNIIPDLPKDEWEISAILVNTRGAFQAQSLMYRFRVAQPEATAVNPASVMREFFDTFLEDSTRVLLVLAALVSVVAAVSILVSIYNSVSARQKEIAVLRALGATRGKVLTLICLEAVLIGLLGGILGLVAGHLVAAGGSVYFEQTVGEGIDWVTVSPNELLYLGVVLMVALLAGLVPALKAYRVPVATNLVAG